MIDKLNQLIESSDSIFITTHLGADPDAVASSLLLSKALALNYPSKRIELVIEEVSYGLDWIDGFHDIKQSPLSSAIKAFKPELLFILDAYSISRCTRNPDELVGVIEDIKTVIIDHHELDGEPAAEIYIHQNSPAVTQDIYDICFTKLGLNKPNNYAQLAMIGIYSDTAGFVHLTDDYKKTFTIVTELVDGGANIESINSQLHQYSQTALEVLAKLLDNCSEYEDFTYSHLEDDYVLKTPTPDIKQGVDIFINEYSRNINGRKSGFVVYKDPLSQKSEYKVSLRSLPGVINVANVAKQLGGGGHKPAAGAQFVASGLDDAVQKIKAAISEK